MRTIINPFFLFCPGLVEKLQVYSKWSVQIAVLNKFLESLLEYREPETYEKHIHNTVMSTLIQTL